MAKEIRVHTDVGEFAGLDFGGSGPDVLLVHGTGQNSAAWQPVADLLGPHCHAVAVDLRGHGQTPAESDDAEQYWRDLGPVCRALELAAPVLAGHSTGGYAITAATAAGVVEPAGLCVLDGFVPDPRADAVATAANTDWDALAGALHTRFGYGWLATEDEFADYVSGANDTVLRALAERSFVHSDEGWLRRPTLPEIRAVSRPDAEAEVYPSVEVYDGVRVPMRLLPAADGFYANRLDRVRAIIDGHPERGYAELPGGHNLHLLRPADVADAIVDLLPRPAWPTHDE